MIKYYTRACNFKYGITAKKLIKKKSALALCGNKSISFSEVEIITRNRKKITSNIVNIKDISKLKTDLRKKLKKIYYPLHQKEKIF